jgi:hypothetical protein
MIQMNDWGYAQGHPDEEFARLHLFSMKKQQGGAAIEFTITVKEFITPKDPALKFFAQADKQTNQRTAPFTPSGWGQTLLTALEECVKAIQRFPYQESEVE